MRCHSAAALCIPLPEGWYTLWRILAPFACLLTIVEHTGGAAGINRNFFASYSDFKITVGYVMKDGQLPYGTSGLSSLGITADGRVRMDSPALFTASRLRTPPDRQ